MERKYKDPSNKVHQIDERYTQLLPGGSVEITDSEAGELLRPLPVVKAYKLAQLERARDAAERANVTVAGKVYSASEAFQAKVIRAINQTGRGKPIAGAADAWRTADAQPVAMTATLLGQIEDAITAQGAAAWTRFWLRFDEVNAPNATVADIEAVVW